jgi:hypothetical protein
MLSHCCHDTRVRGKNRNWPMYWEYGTINCVYVCVCVWM